MFILWPLLIYICHTNFLEINSLIWKKAKPPWLVANGAQDRGVFNRALPTRLRKASPKHLTSPNILKPQDVPPFPRHPRQGAGCWQVLCCPGLLQALGEESREKIPTKVPLKLIVFIAGLTVSCKSFYDPVQEHQWGLNWSWSRMSKGERTGEDQLLLWSHPDPCRAGELQKFGAVMPRRVSWRHRRGWNKPQNIPHPFPAQTKPESPFCPRRKLSWTYQSLFAPRRNATGTHTCPVAHGNTACHRHRVGTPP